MLNCLLLANVMAEERKPLGQLVADLQREYGPHYYGRRDLHIPEEMKQSAIQRARAEGTQPLGRYSVIKKEHLDGVKFFLDAPTNGNGAEAWILFRVSGTEPLLRVYCEAASPELVKEILSAAESFVRNAGIEVYHRQNESRSALAVMVRYCVKYIGLMTFSGKHQLRFHPTRLRRGVTTASGAGWALPTLSSALPFWLSCWPRGGPACCATIAYRWGFQHYTFAVFLYLLCSCS